MRRNGHVKRSPEALRDAALKYQRAKRTLVHAAKAQPCADCGVRYPSYVMDLDHRDRSSKTRHVSAIVTSGSYQAVKDEIAKCDAVCSNCHRIRTHKQGLIMFSGGECAAVDCDIVH